MSSELFKYDSVEVCYGEKAIVEEISFTLKPGEILGIAGESGSGKSTIIKAALGILGPSGKVTKGDIRFQGKNLPDLTEREMQKIRGAKIGMIFQDAGSSFCPVRTIGDQIYETLAAHETIQRREAEERALELLGKLGFKDGRRILESYSFELSGGMNQRIGIVLAMLLNPSVILADEPTSALDVSVQKQAVEEMLLLRELYGTAMVLVTHNIGVISAMADAVLVLKEGRIVEYGAAKQVLNAPREAYTKELMDAVPKLRRS
ncbi:MAG TPA: ABC transporter ATP-binding protein [Candidatus Blautia avistercoris]|nr:ABC transporter ATP-binding protein [Candidatus Blautia avistercoris]